MATVYSANETKKLTFPPTPIGAGEQSGYVRCMYDKYVAAGAIPINTVIQMQALPAGARVVGVQLKFTDLGTVGVLDVGYEGDANAFLSSVDVNTAADTVVSKDIFVKLSTEKHVIITATTATDAAGTIEIAVFYVVD